MTVLNDCVNDARVLNEARALADGGHDVVILGHSSDRRAWSSQVGAGVFIRNVGRPWIPLVRRNKV